MKKSKPVLSTSQPRGNANFFSVRVQRFAAYTSRFPRPGTAVSGNLPYREVRNLWIPYCSHDPMWKYNTKIVCAVPGAGPEPHTGERGSHSPSLALLGSVGGRPPVLPTGCVGASKMRAASREKVKKERKEKVGRRKRKRMSCHVTRPASRGTMRFFVLVCVLHSSVGLAGWSSAGLTGSRMAAFLSCEAD